MITYLFGLICLSLLIFHVATRYCRRGRLLQKIPGPKLYPIIDEFWNVGRKVTKEYYPIASLWTFTTALINVRHPDDLEILFSSQKVIDKGYIYEYLHPWLKTGLLTSTGNKWRQRRKMLTPAFHFRILKKYMDIIEEHGQKLIESLKSGSKETVTNLVPFCSNFTLNVICESAMGVKLDEMDRESSHKYTKAVHDFGNIVIYRMPRPYIQTWMMPFIYKMGSFQRNTLKTLHQFTDKIIKNRKEYHESTENKYLNELHNELEENTFDNIDIGRKKRLAMLDHLLKEERNGLIDYDGIQEEVDTFTFEGNDTTGMAMTYTLLLLAENNKIQERVRTEVTELLDRNEGKIGMTDLQELPYLERCIKESLRLYPPVATLLRYVSEDLQLKNAFIPADTHLMIHLYDTHRDPNYWPDPEKFDPDRFLPENAKNRHPFAYVPFSAGSRNCIGQKFAMMELKCVIARLLYDFYLEPISRVSDVKLMADIVLRPLNPLLIKIVRINK